MQCPITLADNIKFPVAFHHARHQPYECEALVSWLRLRRTDPMTNLPVDWNESPLEIMGPVRESDRVNAFIIEEALVRKTMFDFFKTNKRIWIVSLFLIAAFATYSTIYNGLFLYSSHVAFIAFALAHTIGVVPNARLMVVASAISVFSGDLMPFVSVTLLLTTIYTVLLVNKLIVPSFYAPIEIITIFVALLKSVAHSLPASAYRLIVYWIAQISRTHSSYAN